MYNNGRTGKSKPHGHDFSQSETVTVTNTITETTLMGAGNGSNIIPANHFEYAGAPLHFKAMGGWSKNTASDLTLRVKITQSGVTSEHHKKIFNSNRLGPATSGHWEISALFNAYTVGATGSVVMHAMLQLLENDSAEILGLHSETPAFTLDTTLPFTFFITAEWSVAAIDNDIHSTNVMIW